MNTFESRFGLYDEVFIDDDKSLKAVVISIMWSGEPAYCQCRVSWWHSGTLHQEWLDEARLVPA